MDTNLGQVVLVEDINPSFFYNYYNGSSTPNGSYPRDIVEFNDKLYFSADNGENGSELFVSDGTAEGTQLLIDLRPGFRNYGFSYSSYPSNFIEFNDRLYFTANDGDNGGELFVSDGTAEGTQLLVDINPGSIDGFSDSSYPSDIVEFNDKLYFSANNGENGNELFVSDGTAEGTQLLVDIKPGSNNYGYIYGSNPSYLTELNDKLYFMADNGENGRELFVSDGTAEGTQLLVDLRPGSDGYGYNYGSAPYNLVTFNDKLYFTAENGESGRELFVSDGTAEGTQLLVDLYPGTSINFNRDGSSFVSNNSSFPEDFIEFNDKLYFSANDGENGRELWVTDGTAEGTQLLVDLNPSMSSYGYSYSSNPSNLVEFNGKLYFSANDGEHGNELWATDGTVEGTQLVADIRPGTSSYGNRYSSNPDNLTVVGNELFFAADNGDTGAELFKLTVDDLNDQVISVSGSDGSDNLFGSDSSEDIQALNGQDTIDGGGGNDTLDGGNGDDRLLGGSGDDYLTGGNGSDFLDGGVGADSLDGGNGDDVFVLRVGDGVDTIVDFNLGSDRLGLADGLQFDNLNFAGNNILSSEEVLAILDGIDTEQLTTSEFSTI